MIHFSYLFAFVPFMAFVIVVRQWTETYSVFSYSERFRTITSACDRVKYDKYNDKIVHTSMGCFASQPYSKRNHINNVRSVSYVFVVRLLLLLDWPQLGLDNLLFRSLSDSLSFRFRRCATCVRIYESSKCTRKCDSSVNVHGHRIELWLYVTKLSG